MQPESVILVNIRYALLDMGCMVIKVHGDGHTPAGTPDLIGCWRGRAFAMEIKQPGEDATPIQKYQLGLWSAAGAITGVVHSVQEATDLLEQYRGVES